jgi:hypothetical protein
VCCIQQVQDAVQWQIHANNAMKGEEPLNQLNDCQLTEKLNDTLNKIDLVLN